MLIAKAASNELVSGAVGVSRGTHDKLQGGGVFTVRCFDKEGSLKWEAASPNLVVNEGLQDMNTQYFTGTGYTATWYIGLYGPASSNNPSASDTAALHAGWTELTDYTQSTRPACTFGTATTADPSVISNSGSPAVFSINASVTVGGAFLISNNTKGGTTGILFSAADFAAPGDRTVVNGDTINVTYTFSLDAV